MKQPGMLPPVITRDLTRKYGDRVAVESITLEVAAGTILGVIGPSGSGKTTLIRMMTGTLEPTSGDIRVLGEIPRKFRRQTRERIGYMPQLFVLYPDLTVYENVDFVAALFGLLWGRRARQVRRMLEFVELWDVKGRKAKDLSGGMQRRLELACALVHNPTLIFVDEPTAGIDPVLRQKFWDEFREFREAGRTLVVTTQYVGEAEYCDQVAIIAEGKLVAFGPPEELRRDALGGEVIEVETKAAIDLSLLREMPIITSVRQTGPRRLLAITEDAAVATPRVIEAFNEQGVEVTALHEYRPSFDEVFTELIDRSNSVGDPGGHDGANWSA